MLKISKTKADIKGVIHSQIKVKNNLICEITGIFFFGQKSENLF